MEDTILLTTNDCKNPPKKTSLCGPVEPNKVDLLREVLHILNTTKDDRPFIEVNVAGIAKKGLLDSGSAVTVMIDCPSIKNFDLNPTEVSLKVADGGFLNVLGDAWLPMIYREQTFHVQTVVVEECTQNLILGYDFFKLAGFQIVDPLGMIVATVSVSQPPQVATEIELQHRDNQVFQKVVGGFLITTSKFLGQTPLVTHEICLVDGAKPFFKRPHMYSPALEVKMKAELDSMLAAGIIAPSKSPVASPIVPVTKADGSVRLCLDSRTLNTLTVKDKFPVPNMLHIFARLPPAKYISVVDLSKAFWQVPLSNRKLPGQFCTSQELTAFIFPGRGLFHFTVMPFGLCNSPATQCRLMVRVLGHDLEPFVFCYMDDILILAKTVQHMLELIKEVASRLAKANLSINVAKSRFFAKSIKYLGYNLDAEGMSVDPEKVKVMEEYPKPKNLKELRRFLGLSGYYRRLIKDYSGIAAPLTELLKKPHNTFEWTSETNRAFLELKIALSTSPVVASPDFEAEFILQCDASDYSASAVLGQIQDQREVIIGYFSHKWNGSERNWGATEKEGGCVVYAVRNFRGYLYGRHFVVVTDAQALTHLKSMRMDGTGKLSRWATELNSYDVTIKHRSGKLSVVPDALSRAVTSILAIEEEPIDDPWYARICDNIQSTPERYPDFRLEGRRLFKFEAAPDDIGCYQYRWKEYVPPNARQAVIDETHRQLCHAGSKKSVVHIRRRYFWPGLVSRVVNQLRRCRTCGHSKAKTPTPRVPMGRSRIARYPFQFIALDHFGPTVKSNRGHEWLLVVVDVFSKYVLLHPSRNGGAKEVVNFLERDVFLRMGVPETLLSDNARALVGRRMIELLNKYSVTHWTNAIFHSQSNPAERYIRTVVDAVRSQLFANGRSQRNWDLDIPMIQSAINCTVNEATGKTPFFINFGREMILSGDDYQLIQPEADRLNMSEGEISSQFARVRREVYDHLTRSHVVYERAYNRGTEAKEFQIGDQVWKRNRVLSSRPAHFSIKLAPKFLLATVTRRIGKDTYEVREIESGSTSKLHANDLFPDNDA